MASKLAQLIVVTIIGGIVMALGKPFVPEGYGIVLFVICGGVMGWGISKILTKPTPDLP